MGKLLSVLDSIVRYGVHMLAFLNNFQADDIAISFNYKPNPN